MKIFTKKGLGEDFDLNRVGGRTPVRSRSSTTQSDAAMISTKNFLHHRDYPVAHLAPPVPRQWDPQGPLLALDSLSLSLDRTVARVRASAGPTPSSQDWTLGA